MDTTVKPSFIPKRPIAVGGPSTSSRHLSPLSLVAFIILFAAIILAVGVLVWKISLERDIRDLQGELQAAKEVLDDDVISELVAVSSRLQAAKTLLNNHRAVSAFFDFLEPITMKNVRFRNFTFTAAANNQVSVSMDGEAIGFATLALQSDVILSNAQYFKQPAFSGVAVDKNGVVNFRFTSLIDPSIVSYRDLVKRQEAGEVLMPVTSAASSTPSQTSTTTATTTSSVPGN